MTEHRTLLACFVLKIFNNFDMQIIFTMTTYCIMAFCRHSNSPDFTGSLPKIHTISWSPDFYQILPIFQNIREIS
jgi:hypothetical protein